MEPTPFFEGVVYMIGEKSPRTEVKTQMTSGAAAYLKERETRELARARIPALARPRDMAAVRRSYEEHSMVPQGLI